MTWLNSDPIFLPHLAEIIEVAPTPNAVHISEFKGTTPICGALFDGYNGKSIHAHIWIAPGGRPTRMFWYAVYDYMFEQCKVANVIGTVPSSNLRAIKLDEHLGFRLKTRIENYYPNGDDMLLYVCTPESALPSWKKMRPAVFKFKEHEYGQQKESA